MNPQNVFLEDLNPNAKNLLVNSKVKIIDFNISKIDEKQAASSLNIFAGSKWVGNNSKSRLSQAEPFTAHLKFNKKSSRVGTPIYRPPELWTLLGDYYTEAVDLWGLGCILFTLLTGSDPFSATLS